MSKNVTYIKRHKKGFIYFHWINAVTFFLLFLTAMPLYTNKFLFLYEAFGAETLQTMHHMLGVIFILNPIVALLITARSGIMTLIREVLRFDKDDVKFLVKFPAELIGKEPEGMHALARCRPHLAGHPHLDDPAAQHLRRPRLCRSDWPHLPGHRRQSGFVPRHARWHGQGELCQASPCKMGRGPRERGQARDGGAHGQMSEAIHLPIFP